MNATVNRPQFQSEKLPLHSRLGDWFLGTIRTGRVPALLVTVAAGIVIYGFLFTDEYAVRDITVAGTEFGDPSEIAEISGAFGVSVFRIEPNVIAEHIAALPYVNSSEVTVDWSGNVEIVVEEKQPVLAWRSGVDLYLVDEFGTTIGTASSSPLTTVYLEHQQSPEFSVTVEQVSAVNAVNDAHFDRIVQIEWREIQGLAITLDSNQTVIFGDHHRLPQKLAVFSAVSEQVSEDWDTLDLREPDTPYYK